MGKDTTVESPEVPDPKEIAELDALYNRINTYTPLGNLVYSGDQLNNATLSFSPEQQAQFDLQNQITLGGLQQAIGRQAQLTGLPQLAQGLDFSGLPAIGDSDQRVEQAVFDRAANLLRPEFDRQQNTLQASLFNRGIDPTTNLGAGELDRLDRARNEALQQAAYQAVGIGQQSALQQRQQGIGEQLQNLQQQQVSRNILFNELQALLGQQQTALPGTQAFFAPGQTDVTGAYGISTQAAQAGYATQQQAASQKASDMAGLAGTIAGSAIPSSRAFKEDHGPVTVLDKLASVPVHRWRYHGYPEIHIGPFAEDFHAAFNVGTPLSIHVIDLLGVLLGAVKELHELVKHGRSSPAPA